MSLKLFSLAVTLLLSLSASAIDIARCPQKIQFAAEIERVYNTSKYSKVPGWKKAQAALQATHAVESEFTLVAKKPTTCVYRDYDKNLAVLSTAYFYEEDTNDSLPSDKLIVNLRIDGSEFVTYLPVQHYSTSGIRIYNAAISNKIKAKLYTPAAYKTVDYDLGIISVFVK